MNDRIIDSGDMRKYRTEIPNSIDDAGLSVYAFRLYAHLKRVAGDSGKCWQSTATLAESCNMSGGMISKAKKELQAAHLIDIEQVENKRGGRMFHNITVVDIWMENFIRYSASSQHELASSSHEQTSSQGELKNKPLRDKEEPKEEDAFDFIKTTIETLTGVLPAGEAGIKAINELVELKATEEDIQVGYQWVIDNTGKFRYYSQLVGPTKTAISMRHQKTMPQASRPGECVPVGGKFGGSA